MRQMTLALALVLGACSGSDGKDGAQGQPGTDGAEGAGGPPGEDGTSALVSTTLEEAGENCPTGGYQVRAGLDANDNGELDDAEVVSTAYVCNGEEGTGLGSLVRVSDEAAGDNCAAGGQLIESGLDIDGSGTLEAGEVTATRYVCNGADGADGAPGADGADGLACWDLNGNGTCDAATEDADSNGTCEATDCQGTDGTEGADGADGADGLACWDLNGNGACDIATEDTNGSGTCDAADCQGADGVDGAPGTDGADGADGISCWDLNGNGTCDTATEDTNGSGACDAADCQGADGADGAPGTDGADGADGISCWDLNGNGTCDTATEDTDSSGTCDVADCQGPAGADGTDGTDGLNSLLLISDEPPGSNCVHGGHKIETGLDVDGDDVLDPDEVNAAATSYICSTSLPPEVPEGPSCDSGLQCSGESCCTSMVVPDGTFPMGRCETAGCSDEYAGSADETPEHPATLTECALDKYEVTVGRFAEFLAAYDAGWRPTVGQGANAAVESAQGLALGATGWQSAWDSQLPSIGYEVTSGDGSLEDLITCSSDYQTWDPVWAAPNDSYPINCVNWYEAFAFCIWDGGRLATEAEWERAAAGGTRNGLYPWGGDAPTASHANFTGGANLPFVAVGSAPLGNGRWGHSDLAGSMNEWTFDWYATDWYTVTQAGCSDCANVTAASVRMVRGGSWGSNAVSLRSASREGFGQPATRYSFVGVRCARTP